jgi:hypothetical protein
MFGDQRLPGDVEMYVRPACGSSFDLRHLSTMYFRVFRYSVYRSWWWSSSPSATKTAILSPSGLASRKKKGHLSLLPGSGVTHRGKLSISPLPMCVVRRLHTARSPGLVFT